MSAFSRTSAIFAVISIVLLQAMPAFAQNNAIKQASEPALKRPAVQSVKPPVKNKLEAAKEKMASREGALKAKLQKFKDQKKANLAERINTNLNIISQNHIRMWEKHLNTMSAITDKLENRVNQGTPDIKDPEAAREAISLARTAIASASSAVSLQALNDYTINITSESRIRTAAKLQRDKLHKDISSVRKLVIEAKQKVAGAVRIAKSGKVEIINKEAQTNGTR